MVRYTRASVGHTHTWVQREASDTINQAALPLCMNQNERVPTSETTSAMSKLRKVDDLTIRQSAAAELFLAEIATAIGLVS